MWFWTIVPVRSIAMKRRREDALNRLLIIAILFNLTTALAKILSYCHEMDSFGFIYAFSCRHHRSLEVLLNHCGQWSSVYPFKKDDLDRVLYSNIYVPSNLKSFASDDVNYTKCFNLLDDGRFQIVRRHEFLRLVWFFADMSRNPTAIHALLDHGCYFGLLAIHPDQPLYTKYLSSVLEKHFDKCI